MIKQHEIEVYVDLKQQYESLEKAFKAQRNVLIDRVKKEGVEKGQYSLDLKEFDKTTVQYKQVVEGIKGEIENLTTKSSAVKKVRDYLLGFIAELFNQNAKITTQAKLDVKEIKLQKVA